MKKGKRVFSNMPTEKGYNPRLGSGKSFFAPRKKTRNKNGGINLLG
jgi:hypothetical protein